MPVKFLPLPHFSKFPLALQFQPHPPKIFHSTTSILLRILSKSHRHCSSSLIHLKYSLLPQPLFSLSYPNSPRHCSFNHIHLNYSILALPFFSASCANSPCHCSSNHINLNYPILPPTTILHCILSKFPLSMQLHPPFSPPCSLNSPRRCSINRIQ